MSSGAIKTIFAIILITAAGFAQSILTIDESIQLGLKNSELLHASQMKVISAEARESEINTARLPQLKLNASYTRLSEIDPFAINTPFGDFIISPSIVNNYNVRLSLTQPVFTGFRLSASSDAAGFNSLAVKKEYSKDEQDLILNIKNAYWGLFKAKKFKAVVDENVEQIRAHLKDVENFFNQGLATNNDLLKIQVQLSEALLRQIEAKNGVQLSAMNLKNQIGLPLNDNIDIKEDIKSFTIDLKSIDELVEAAYKNRPELEALDFRIKASESGIKAAQASWYPQIYLSGNYLYANPNQRIFPAEEKWNATWDVSVSLQYDLWNWGATSDQTTQAKALYEQVKDSYKTAKDFVTLDVTQNFLLLQQASEKMNVSGQSIEQAKENYRVTYDKYLNGLILNSEVIDAEVALLQANTNYIQSLVDYEMAKARLERSVGVKNL